MSDTGSCPGRDFFESLDTRERAKAQALFDLLSETRQVQNEQKFRTLRGSVRELKTTNSRFTCFFDPRNRLVVIAGFKKERAKAPREQIDRAETVIAAYEA